MANRSYAALILVALLAPACDEAGEPNDSDFRAGCFPAGGAGLIGLDSIAVGGTAGINGAAGVFSNKLVKAWGTADVDTDAISGGTVEVSGGASISGTITQGAITVTVPDPTGLVAAAATANDNAKIPCVKQGNSCKSPVSGGVLTLNSTTTLVLTAGNYYFKGIAINGQAKLGTKGAVTIYLDGGATFNGGSATNVDTDSLTIISSSSAPLKLNGAAQATMNIYAPFADVTFSGTMGFFGTALGKTITTVGTTDLSLSGSLDDLWDIGCELRPTDIPEPQPE